jgi:methionyl aminopeptidase
MINLNYHGKKVIPHKLIQNFLSKKISSKQPRQKYFDSFDFEQINLVNPAGNIPSHLKRPNYVLNPKYEPKYKEASIIKDPEDLKKFRRACKIAAGAVERAIKIVEEGITTEDVDQVVHNYIVSQDAYPSGVGYMGFPKSVCTSVNESNIFFYKLLSNFINCSCLPWNSQ